MRKGISNERYAPEFKKMVIETMLKKLSYRETARRFEVSSDTQIKDWERIYRPEGVAVERRRRGSSGQLKKLSDQYNSISGCFVRKASCRI